MSKGFPSRRLPGLRACCGRLPVLQAIVDYLELGQVAKVKISGLNLSRVIFMIRKRLETPHRPQEVFWSFIRSPENADLLKLAEE